MPSPTGFTDAVTRAGVTYRQADYWIRRGWVQVLHDGGTGQSREITRGEAEVLRLMGQLTQIGLKPAVAAETARLIQETGAAVLGDFVILRKS